MRLNDRQPTARVRDEGHTDYRVRLRVTVLTMENAPRVTLQMGRSNKRQDDGTMGQTMGHLAARESASRYMARCLATRQATELTMV